MEEDRRVIESGEGLTNSRESVKNDLQAELDSKYEHYSNSTGLKVKCRVRAVDSSAEPFEVEVNSTVWVEKGNVSHGGSVRGCKEDSQVQPPGTACG